MRCLGGNKRTYCNPQEDNVFSAPLRPSWPNLARLFHNYAIQQLKTLRFEMYRIYEHLDARLSQNQSKPNPDLLASPSLSLGGPLVA